MYSTLFSLINIIVIMILLPRHPVSLKHKNPQRCKQIHGMHTIGCNDGSSHLTGVLVEISNSCNFCGSYYGCHLMMHSFSLCCALKKKDYILISLYCNVIQSFGVCLQIYCLVTMYIGGQAFSFWDWFLSLVFLTLTHWFLTGTHDFSQDESHVSP